MLIPIVQRFHETADGKLVLWQEVDIPAKNVYLLLIISVVIDKLCCNIAQAADVATSFFNLNNMDNFHFSSQDLLQGRWEEMFWRSMNLNN